jgi:hypothetical protein
MHKFRPHKIRSLALLSILGLLVYLLAPLVQPARAASLSSSYIRLNRMTAATNSDLRVVFTTSSTNGTEGKVVITLTGFTVNTTQAVSSGSCAAATGATALPGSLTAVGDNSAKTITISAVTDLTVSTAYCVDLTTASAVTNPSAGAYTASIATQTSGAAAIDSQNQGLRIVANDQIVVSAVVPPTFNLALSGNTDAFSANLAPASVVSTGGRTATLTTNAAKGWIAWVKSASVGLASATAPYTIPTAGTVNAAPNTLVAGTEGYVLDADLTTDAASGGAVTIDPEYNGTTTAQGGTLSTTYQPFASANGTANGDVITLIERAAIAGQTPAANDYTDTLTIVGAGSF